MWVSSSSLSSYSLASLSSLSLLSSFVIIVKHCYRYHARLIVGMLGRSAGGWPADSHVLQRKSLKEETRKLVPTYPHTLPTYPPSYLPTYPPTYLPTYLPILPTQDPAATFLLNYHPPPCTYQSHNEAYFQVPMAPAPLLYLPTYLPIHLPTYLPTYLPPTSILTSLVMMPTSRSHWRLLRSFTFCHSSLSSWSLLLQE